MAITHTLEKMRRFLRWRFAPGASLPVWWHVGRPNFGDDINPAFFQAVSGHRVRFAVDGRRPHVLGAGSILERATPASVVCGSGFLRPPGLDVPRPARMVAVRGALSRAAFATADDVFLGDPLVLVSEWMAPVSKRHQVGLVPHLRSVRRWRALNTRGLHVIDPGLEPWRVVEEIAACDMVLSQSLHGLIVADALGVPNVWVAPSDEMAGGRFKFDDYFSTLDQPKECVPEGPEVFTRPEAFAAATGCYRFSKADYRQVLARACEEVVATAASRAFPKPGRPPYLSP